MKGFRTYLLALLLISFPLAAAAQEKVETVPSVQVVTGDDVVEYARTFKGVPYKLGAAGPKAFDCSSYTRYVYRHFGYDITAYSQVQFREGRPVDSYSDLQKGDLVFFGKRRGVRTIGHVGIVVSVDRERGSFTFIHASVSGGVMEQTSSHPYFMMRYMGARRLLPGQE
ncbi:MAG: C40 family peptidase [Bacteroidales bacterium]|nr:C40 family peptidase [Bacteroidales bacterium]